MVGLGIVLLVIGLLLSQVSFLTTVGIVLIGVGLVLNLVPIGGTRRRVW